MFFHDVSKVPWGRVLSCIDPSTISRKSEKEESLLGGEGRTQHIRIGEKERSLIY